MNAKTYNKRRISSSQKGFENVAEGTRYDDYYIDTRGMGILDVENIIDAIESRGNQAVLTVQSSDGSVQHTYFTSKSWKDYKDTKNNSGVAITDVWVTEVKGGSYVRNSRRLVKSGFVEEHGIYHNDTWKLEVVKLQGNTAMLKPVKEDSYFCVKNPEIDEQGDLIWTSDTLPMTDYETALKEFNYHKDLNGASPTFNSRRLVKSERVTDGGKFTNVMFELINEMKLKKDYIITRPSWDNFNFDHKYRDGSFTIYIDEENQVVYGSVLGFGEHENDIFKYETEKVNVDSYNIKRECRKIIIDCTHYLEDTIGIVSFENEQIESSRRPIKSSFVIEHWSPLLPQTQYVCDTDEGFGGTYNVDEALQFDTMMEAKQFIKEHDEEYGGKLKIHRFPIESSFIRSARYIATDPETGEVLGSADTYEEAVNKWGEDVTITDSEVGDGTDTTQGGILSSWDNDTPRGEGWLAHDDGKQKNECPYERGTEEYEDWIDGWEAAYQEVNSSRKPIKSSISATALEEQLDGQFWTRTEDFEDEVNEAGWDIEDVNDEYATISNDKGSQYEVRFYDHGEGRSFTMESFKCIYCDEDDENDEIESSNQLDGDKAFLSNIVSSVLTQSMTKEQAVKRIALRNNCNQAFARNILSSALKDTSLIQSGVMAIADDINKDFNIDGDIESWFTDYVPREGTANTVGGEILRAFTQIRGRYYNDGDRIGIGMGKENVNPAARYLIDKCVGWTEVSNIEEMLSGDSDINKDNNSYKEWIEDCEYSLEDYLRNNEDYFHTVNKDDMWDYKTEYDNYNSIDEIFIMDNDNNEYWFQGNGDGWHCYTINYSHQPKYHVDEWVDDLDDIPDTSGDFCDFELDGFEYSAEKSSNNTDWMITDVRLPNGIVQVDEEWETSDFEPYEVYDNQGREISINDLY